VESLKGGLFDYGWLLKVSRMLVLPGAIRQDQNIKKNPRNPPSIYLHNKAMNEHGSTKGIDCGNDGLFFKPMDDL